MRLPSGDRATADGYQPVGISPRTRSRRPWSPASSTTSTSLLPALAANSRVPSRETASALGWVPTAAPGYGLIGMVRRTQLLVVSTTEMVSASVLAAYSSSRTGLSAIALGWVPTVMWPVTFLVVVSTVDK